MRSSAHAMHSKTQISQTKTHEFAADPHGENGVTGAVSEKKN